MASRPTSHSDDIVIPKGMLIAVGLMMALALALAAISYRTDTGMKWTPAGPAKAERSLRFEDRAAGAVGVIDAKTGAQLAEISPGDGGFLRVAMRGLAMVRRNKGIGQEPPFQLALWQDNALTLEDTATGKRIYLSAFGADNAATFGRFLPPREAR